jgi:hypothetical protein
MGGRGSMGGTRSTYRGDSTSQFLLRQQQGNDGGGGGGGGGNTSTKDGNNRSSDSGGIDNGGGNGNGGGGSVTDLTANETTVNDQNLPPDQDLEALFQASPEWLAFDKKYENASAETYQRKYDEALAKWIGQNPAPSPSGPAPGSVGEPINFRKKAFNGRSLEDITADVETVNRLYKTGNGEYEVNCQRCANAVEFRAKGYDVKAQPVTEGIQRRPYNPVTKKFEGGGASVTNIARQWVKEDGEVADWDYQTSERMGKARAIREMEAEVVSWGEGARGFIYVTWKGGVKAGSHIWNVEVRNGKAFYIDGQTNEIGEAAESWKESFSPHASRGVMRVDNLYPRSGNALSWVKERTPEEINAPTQTATIARMGQLLAVSDENTRKRNAFYKGWEFVYKGYDPSPPAWVAAEPELLNWFNQGLAWARRPD